jgi:hypothetical protein
MRSPATRDTVAPPTTVEALVSHESEVTYMSTYRYVYTCNTAASAATVEARASDISWSGEKYADEPARTNWTIKSEQVAVVLPR